MSARAWASRPNALLAALGLLAAFTPAQAAQDMASAVYFYDGDGEQQAANPLRKLCAFPVVSSPIQACARVSVGFIEDWGLGQNRLQTQGLPHDTPGYQIGSQLNKGLGCFEFSFRSEMAPAGPVLAWRCAASTAPPAGPQGVPQLWPCSIALGKTQGPFEWNL